MLAQFAKMHPLEAILVSLIMGVGGMYLILTKIVGMNPGMFTIFMVLLVLAIFSVISLLLSVGEGPFEGFTRKHRKFLKRELVAVEIISVVVGVTFLTLS